MNRGLKNYTKQLTQKIGNAGTAYVNVNENDANMHLVLPLVKTVGLMPFEVNLIYTHSNRDVEDKLFGKGFKTDWYSELGYNGSNMWLINADGSRDDYTEGVLNPETQLKLSKSKDSYDNVTNLYVHDKYGNEKCYDMYDTRYPQSVTGKKGTISVNFTTSNKTINNNKGDVVILAKGSTGYIENILYKHNGSNVLMVNIGYNSDRRISSLTYRKNNIEIAKTEITYTANTILLKDVVSGEFTRFGYLDNKITIFSDRGRRTTSISYDDDGKKTTVTDFMGNTSYYIFDKNDLPRYEIVTDKSQSNYVFTETNYDAKTKQLLSQSAPINIKSENLFTGKISNFTKGYGAISFSDVDLTDSLFKVFLGSTVCRVTGNGMISYKIPKNVIATDTVTAAIFGKLISGKATFSIYAGKSSEQRNFNDCGDNNFDLLSVGVNAEQTFDHITVDLTLQNDAVIDLGGLYVSKKNFGAFYQYDSDGNTTQSGNRGTTEYSYNSNNLPTRSIGADSTLIDYEHDNKGNLTKATTAYGVTVKNTYDSNSNPTKCTMTNADGQIMETAKTYTDDGFVKTETDELENVTSYEYCDDGNIQRVTDALGAVTHLNYYDNGLIKELITSKGGRSANAAYEYDGKHLLQKVTLANGSEYFFTYTDQNWLEEVQLNNNTVFKFEYDNKTGKIMRQIYGSGDSFVFSYNTDGNISNVFYLSSDAATLTVKYGYSYNALKQLSSIKDKDGIIIRRFDYDSDGRVKTVKENNATISVGYDNLGNVNNQSFSLSGKAVSQSFDTVQRSKGSHPESIVGAFGKYNYVATFEKDANILCGTTGFKPTDNVTLSKLGIIPCARVTADNPLRYDFNLKPKHLYECDCVMFWFKPDSPDSTYYLFTAVPQTEKSEVAVGAQSGHVVLFVTDAKGNTTNLIISDNKIQSGWNFFALNIYTREDEGSAGVTEYSITLNAQTKAYQKKGTVIDVGLSNNTKFRIGCGADEFKYMNMNGYITALCIAERTYLYLDEIQKYYRLTKDYIIENRYVSGDVKTVDFGQTTLYNIDRSIRSKFEICPLHNSVTSLNGKAPNKFDLRRSSDLDKDRTFNFNNLIKRYAYVADGSMLQYDFGNGSEGTVMMRAYTDTERDKQYLLEGTDSNNHKFGLYRGADGYLYIDNNGEEFKTTLNFGLCAWHTVGISYKREIELQGYTQNSNMVYRVYLDGNVYTIQDGKDVSFGNVYITVGRKTEGERTIYNMGAISECYPLHGQIEMLAANKVFNELSTIQKLANELNVFSKTTEYDELGMLKKVDLHKSGTTKLSHTYTYKKRSDDSPYISGLVEKENIKYGSISVERKYEYDALGRVTQITDGTFGNHKYTYDYRGFLLTSGYEEFFEYDANGNIKRHNDANFVYDRTVRDKLIYIGGNAVRYANKESLNPIYWNGRSYDYEGRRLIKFSYNGASAEYTYDDQSRRIKKVIDGKTTNYYYSGDLLMCEDGPNGRLDFLYDENGQIYGFIQDNSNKYFYIKDMLGTILGIAEENGNIAARYSYTAFGECTITKNDLSNIAVINPFRFKGYYYDNESGMYYCHTRYLVPEWGRWLNPDNPSFLKFDNINGMNLFAYCGNNPVMNVDPNGNAWYHWVIGLALVAATTLAMVATAGLAATIIGASAAVASGMIAGAGIATATAGVVNLVVQHSNGIEEFDLGSLMGDMLLSGTVGMISGGIGGALGSFSAGAQAGTRMFMHIGAQIAVNTCLSVGAYVLQSAIKGENLTLYGIGIAAYGGYLSGLTFNASPLSSLFLTLGLEIAGYGESILEIINNF